MNESNEKTTKTPLPLWLKIAAAAGVGAGTVVTGQRLATDSPVHFAVEGAAPEGADAQWICAPEGGIVGAPMVCRPRAEVVAAVAAARSTSTSTDK